MKKKTNLIELQSSTSIEDSKAKGRGSSDTEEVDVFIPTTQGNLQGRRFGFVRYNCSMVAEMAVSKVNWMWCFNKSLQVKMATFEQGGNGKSAQNFNQQSHEGEN